MSYPELGFYLLPGHTRTPTDALAEIRAAEQMGIGSAWISERFDVKEASAICGAMAAVTSDIYIGTAATNINIRHPMATAAMASTLSGLSNGRFALGVARGVGIRYDLWGIPKVKNRDISDFVDMMRQLWTGERVMGYDGPLGKFPYMHMADWVKFDIPQLFVGFGPKSLKFAGSLFDGVILHTFIGDAALSRAVELVREGAREAGRDPQSVKVWSVLATACEPTREDHLRKIVARMATYMQAPGYAEMLAALNDWDIKVLEDFRQRDVVKNMLGGIDSVATLEQLEEISQYIPEDWLPAAVGSAATCARRWQDQFDAGADGVVIHASTPQEFAPVLKAYDKIRQPERFAGRTNRPA